MQTKLLIGIGVVLVVIVIVLVSVFGCSDKTNKPKYKMDLEVWGVFDDSDVFNEILQQYRKKNPQIGEIHYKKMASGVVEYQTALLDAMATGNGPDVFFFHNTWLPLHKNKTAANPNSAATIVPFKNNFVDVAYDDFVENNQIYAMPLECDTLALYYNKDLFNQAGISYPPRTWDEVVTDVKFLNKYDDQNNITQSTIALGRSKGPGGVNRASDIVMLMMMQAGTTMYRKEAYQVSFDRSYANSVNLGQSALDYYLRFSRGSDAAYTWNSTMDYSVDSFAYGKTAMMINYSYYAKRLPKDHPKLNFAVATVPQLDAGKPVNFANYWGLAVSANKNIITVPGKPAPNYTNTDRIKEAWKFVEFATMQPQAADQNAFDPADYYLQQTKKTAARRDLIDKQKTDPVLGVFAQQALTAKSWPQPDSLKVEEIFMDMIDEVANGSATSANALRTAGTRVETLIKKEN